MTHRLALLGTMLALSLMLPGCGGGGGDGDQDQTGTASYTMVPLHPDGIPSTNTIAWAIDPTGNQQGGVQFNTIADPRALIWAGTKESFVDLGPGEIRSVGGGVQVGYTGAQGLPSERAVLWIGTEASRVDLHPAGYTRSIAFGGDATIQVGRGTIGGDRHAIFWRGTAASFVDLHPPGFTSSEGSDGAGDVQVGTGNRMSDGTARALIWNNTAGSVVDMGPGIASALSGDTQVGQGIVPGFTRTHALLWRGTEASRVDLHPAGFEDSRALGVAGGRQVGEGTTTGGSGHALVWEGTAASVIDLHPTTQSYLIDGAPPTSSSAQGIDAAGNVVGTVQSSTTGTRHAVLWMRN